MRLLQPLSNRTPPAPRRSFRRRLLRRSVLGFVLVAYVIPDVYSSVSGASCDEWRSRDVGHTPLDTEALVEISKDTTQLRIPVLPAGFSGMALPGVVAFDREPSPELWVHEMVHQQQMHDHGVARFAATYVVDWFTGRYHGCGPRDAYSAVRYETQAWLAANKVTEPMRQAYLSGGGVDLVAYWANPPVDSPPTAATAAATVKVFATTVLYRS